jgi:hypothetical protein
MNKAGIHEVSTVNRYNQIVCDFIIHLRGVLYETASSCLFQASILHDVGKSSGFGGRKIVVGYHAYSTDTISHKSLG